MWITNNVSFSRSGYDLPVIDTPITPIFKIKTNENYISENSLKPSISRVLEADPIKDSNEETLIE